MGEGNCTHVADTVHGMGEVYSGIHNYIIVECIWGKYTVEDYITYPPLLTNTEHAVLYTQCKVAQLWNSERTFKWPRESLDNC